MKVRKIETTVTVDIEPETIVNISGKPYEARRVVVSRVTDVGESYETAVVVGVRLRADGKPYQTPSASGVIVQRFGGRCDELIAAAIEFVRNEIAGGLPV